MSQEDDWQPAIVLPLNRLCSFHFAHFSKLPENILRIRETCVGKICKVRPSDRERIKITKRPEFGYCKSGPNQCQILEFECLGHVGVVFSCEVSTD